MSLGEREACTGLITTLIVIVLFLWRLTGHSGEGLFDEPEGLQTWARTVLVLVAWSIPVAIAVTIGFHVLYEVISGEKTDDRRDERDRNIERRALTLAWYVLSFGLLGVIIDLALGASALRAMTMILGLCAVVEIFKDSLKLWLYRRGA